MSGINCNGNLIDLDTPRVMGILNVTPDSFYDGGKYHSEKEILNRAAQILDEGGDFVDIGAYSSRPGADHISAAEESNRLIPAIKLIKEHFPEAKISADTFRSTVAQSAVEAGACMINDISGGNLDPEMFKTVRKLQVPYILMHMPGNPKTMQKLTQYKDVTQELIYFFSEKIHKLRELGINDLIIDPGFGFGKTLEQNYELLRNLDLFQVLEVPLLVGISRKSMLYRLLNTSASEALNATTVAHTIALLKGARILRVHDVKQAVEAVKITQLIR